MCAISHICGDRISVGRAELTPHDAAIGRTRTSARWFVIVPHALYAFIRIHIINALSCWVIIIIHDRPYWTLIDTRTARYANISNLIFFILLPV